MNDPWSLAIKSGLERVGQSVVHVSATGSDEDGVTVGSGVVLDAFHVVTTAQIAAHPEIELSTSDRRIFRGTLVGSDPLYFLAVVRAERRLSAQPARIAPADHLAAGQMVIAVGDPFGYGPNVSLGVISVPDRTIYRPERLPVDGLIITDARIHPGNTGGALAWLDGQLVGICGVPWTHGFGLAVQAETMARVANQIIEYGQATHPWLGFSGEPEVLDRVLIDLLSLRTDRGLRVMHVNDQGPGARAGVVEGDLVVEVMGRPVTTVGQIRKFLSLRRPGDEVPMVVLRDGAYTELSLPVEEMPRLRQEQ